MFQDWQRTHTQSSVTVLPDLRQRMDVRFCEGRNHRREAQMRAANSGRFAVRAPPKRASGELCSPLTKTYMEVGKPEAIQKTGFEEVGRIGNDKSACGEVSRGRDIVPGDVRRIKCLRPRLPLWAARLWWALLARPRPAWPWPVWTYQSSARQRGSARRLSGLLHPLR